METLLKVAKAITAGAAAFAAALASALTDGGVSSSEWIVIAIATVGAGIAVWRVPNKTA